MPTQYKEERYLIVFEASLSLNFDLPLLMSVVLRISPLLQLVRLKELSGYPLPEEGLGLSPRLTKISSRAGNTYRNRNLYYHYEILLSLRPFVSQTASQAWKVATCVV